VDNLASSLLSIFGGIITLALVAVVVSRNARSADAIHAAGSALSNVVGAAVAPLNDTNKSVNLGLNSFTAPAIGGNTKSGAFYNLFGEGA
jgi:hypothetical protein